MLFEAKLQSAEIWCILHFAGEPCQCQSLAMPWQAAIAMWRFCIYMLRLNHHTILWPLSCDVFRFRNVPVTTLVCMIGSAASVMSSDALAST